MGLQQITGNEIAAGSIAASDLASASITGDKLGATSINANNIVGGTITTTQIASNTISNTNIQTGAIENYSRATGLLSGMRNRIINGAMVIDQRNAGASITPTDGQYVVDRFNIRLTQSSKLTAQQNQGSVTLPAGFTNYIGVTSSSAYSVISSDNFNIVQIIEGTNVADLGWGTANAKTVTLSFRVRSSLTGTFGGAITNSALDRSYPFSYTISVANTFEYKTVEIEGDTSGTWLTTNGQGIRVWFGLGVGTDLSGTADAWAATQYASATGAVSVVGTNGATFYITGVQLEVGSTATSFDYRPFGTELALCQRYFYLAGTGNSVNIGNGYYHGLTQVRTAVIFPVSMRSTPTLVSTSGSNYYQMEKSGGADLFNSLTIYQSNSISAVVYNASEVSGTDGFAANIVTNNASTFVGFSAEL